MGKVTAIRAEDARQIIRLFGDLRGCTDPVEQGRRLVDGVSALVDADAGWFVEFVEKNGAWVPIGTGAGSTLDGRVVRYMHDWGRQFPVEFDVMATRITADRRPAFVQTWADARRRAPKARLEPFADLVNTLDIADMADPVFALNPDHRFAMNFQRNGPGRRSFSAREHRLLELIAGELHWLHTTGRLTLSTLTRQNRPLFPALPVRLNQVLLSLLDGRSPKQIATALRLSVHTVRDHIKRLYAVFEVAGRDELMAKFIKRE